MDDAKNVQPTKCPTCGKKAKLWLQAWTPDATVASSDRLCSQLPADGKTHLEAIAKWNTRTEPSL